MISYLIFKLRTLQGLTGTERLIIYTEEQIKTFSLPTMKPSRFRYKFTGVEGSRIRKAQLLTLRSATSTSFNTFELIFYENRILALDYRCFFVYLHLKPLEWISLTEVIGILVC